MEAATVSNYISDYGVRIVLALIIFLVGKWAAKKLTALLRMLMHGSEVDETLVSFASNAAYMLMMLFVILAALSKLGVETTSFIAVLGAAGLAVGLALQGTLSNVGAAVMIILFRPFRVGDFVEAGGATGTVESVNMFSTTISPIDNRTIIVPNSKIIGGNIVNFSNKETRRVDHLFGIGYGDDLKLAKEILMGIADADERVLDEPAPFVAVSELGESSVNLVMRTWVKSGDYWDVYFDQVERVKLSFDERGISIPYPQMDLHLDKPE
jgi:small conductance mechanosensitive channel